MALDRIEESGLIIAFWLDSSSTERTLATGFDESTQGCFWIGNQHPQHAVQIAVIEGLPAALQLIIIGEDLLSASDVAWSSFNFDGLRAEVYVDVQAVFQHMQVFVAGAEQGFYVGANFKTLLHSDSVFRVPSGAVARCKLLDVAGGIKERSSV